MTADTKLDTRAAALSNIDVTDTANGVGDVLFHKPRALAIHLAVEVLRLRAELEAQRLFPTAQQRLTELAAATEGATT